MTTTNPSTSPKPPPSTSPTVALLSKPWTMPLLLAAMLGVAYATSSTVLEIVATVTGLLCVWLTARENIWAWPIGLVNVGCFFICSGK